MLDQNDVKQIKQVLDESLDEKLSVAFNKKFDEKFPVAIDAALEKFAVITLNKSFQSVEDGLTTIEDKVDRLDAKVDRLDATIHNQYPNKEYLDSKLADAVSEIGLRILKRDEKEKNFKLYLIDVLKTHLHVPEDVTVKLRELAEVK